MAVTRQQLSDIVCSHAWDPTGESLAVCPNSNEVNLHQAGRLDTAWPKQDTIEGHSCAITSVDWSSGHGRLVTCSQDRSAYVWQYAEDAKQWKRQRVVMRIHLAALCVRWSPNGEKFAVGGSDKSLSVCYFEEQDAWWACRSLARGTHTSSIVAVAWHPSSQMLATACTDGRCRIVNASLPGVDEPSGQVPICAASRCGDVLLEVASEGGWCTDVAWSPSGRMLAFTAHQSAIGILGNLDAGQAALDGFRSLAVVRRETVPFLPLRTLAFLSEGALVAAGFDCAPVLFAQRADGSWVHSSIGQGQQGCSELQSSPIRAVTKNFSSKLAMFQSPSPTKVERRQGDKQHGAPAHANAIVELRPLPGPKGRPGHRFSTCGWDGRVVVWEVPELTPEHVAVLSLQ